MEGDQELIDNVDIVETPEGVDIELIPAGPLARILAYVIDLIFRGIILLCLSLLLQTLEQLGSGIYFLLLFAIEWLYPVLFEQLSQGQTPGKKMMKLTVLDSRGLPPSLSQSLLRNLLRGVDFLPIGYLFGLCSMALSHRFQRLGDRIANTLVVYSDRPAQQALKLPPLPAPLPAPLTLQADEQAAIAQLGLRSAQLSEARQQELSELLSGTELAPAGQERQQLLALSAHLLGADKG